MRRLPLARFLAAVVLAGAALAAVPTAALATFHLVQVREVYPGSAADPQAEYVELQMWAQGQDLLAGHAVRTFDATGAVTSTSSFPADLSRGQNQSTMVLATPQAEAQLGFAADGSLTVPGALDPAGGAVCWEALDCVSWGTFAGTLPSPAGQPAVPAGIPDGMALRRAISRGCPTLLDPADDNDESAADFAAVFPAPRPNSVPPTEKPCTPAGGGSGPAGGSDGGGSPQTLLRHHPPRRSADPTPTFRFASDQAGATFECSLDRRPFRRCRSPFTAKRLAAGSHRFRVRARGPEGAADPSPASWRFRVLRHG